MSDDDLLPRLLAGEQQAFREIADREPVAHVFAAIGDNDRLVVQQAGEKAREEG